MSQFLLVDASGYIYRAFYALPPMIRPDGVAVSAVFGFLKMLAKSLKEENCEYLGIVFDKGRSSFRHEIYPQYKAGRAHAPEDLVPQFALIREAVCCLGFKTIELDQFEADDIIASYALFGVQQGLNVKILSSDKDMCQLVGKGIVLYDPMKSREVTAEVVFEKFGVQPEQMCDFLSLAGDASDGIPGVYGVGAVTAAKLLSTYGSLEAIFEALPSMKASALKDKLHAQKDQAFLSKRLVELNTSLSIENSVLKEMVYRPLTEDNIKSFCQFLRDQSFAPKNFEFFLKSSEIREVVVTSDSTLREGLLERKRCAILWEESTGMVTCAVGDQVFQCSVERLSEWKDFLGDSSVLKVGYNLRPFLSFCKKHELPVQSIADLQIMSFVLYSGQHNHALETLIELYGTGVAPTIKEKTLECLRLYSFFQKELPKNKVLYLYECIEHPLIFVLMNMEIRGMYVDKGRLEEVGRYIQESLQKAEDEIFYFSEEIFNIASNRKIGTFLFEKLGLPSPQRKTKSGDYVTDSTVLESLKASHPVVSSILDWRFFSKMLKTYVLPLMSFVGQDNILHTTFCHTGARTGRLSSMDPNLQNIPRDLRVGKMLRSAFLPPQGSVFLSLDYDQMELRILAEIGGVSSMKKIFEEGGDIHTLVASEIFDIPSSAVTQEERNKAKAINFGILYGMSPFGLAQHLGVPFEEAKQIIDRYFLRIPEIQQYIEGVCAFCARHGYVLTAWGRKIHIPEMLNKVTMAHGKRRAINAPIQGTCADIVKYAMIESQAVLGAELCLQLHDELLWVVPENHVEHYVVCLSKCMLAVPFQGTLKLTVKTGTSWGEMVPWKGEE